MRIKGIATAFEWCLRKKLAGIVISSEKRLDLIARRQVVAPKAQILLNSWKKVHVPFTTLLTGFSAVHIWDAWSRAW